MTLSDSTWLTSIDDSATFFTHYCSAKVWITVDYHSQKTEVSAYIGTAPDSHTIIVYPYRTWDSGYMNKSAARKLAASMKRELKEFIKARGIKLSEPMEYQESWNF